MIRLDGDGNTQGLIIGSDALEFHMVNGRPAAYRHGTGSDMMRTQMGF